MYAGVLVSFRYLSPLWCVGREGFHLWEMTIYLIPIHFLFLFQQNGKKRQQKKKGERTKIHRTEWHNTGPTYASLDFTVNWSFKTRHARRDLNKYWTRLHFSTLAPYSFLTVDM